MAFDTEITADLGKRGETARYNSNDGVVYMVGNSVSKCNADIEENGRKTTKQTQAKMASNSVLK
jgi:hypothetical protein